MGLGLCRSFFLSSTLFTRSRFSLAFDSWREGHPGFGGGRSRTLCCLIGAAVSAGCVYVCVCVWWPKSKAGGRPKMASEDCALEDLPRDQLIDSPEQGDPESSVGHCGRSRPQHRRFLSLRYCGPSLFCQFPRSFPVKTSTVSQRITCEF